MSPSSNISFFFFFLNVGKAANQSSAATISAVNDPPHKKLISFIGYYSQ